MSITITSNANEVAEQVSAYISQLTSKYNKALKQITEIGAKTAQREFASALYSGENDVKVDVKKISASRYQIVASGGNVLFIEFGTGISFPEVVEPSGLTYIHGTYGKLQGLNPNGWTYKGEAGNYGKDLGNGVVHTKGNPPAKAMYQASKDMRSQYINIMRKEFKSK